MRYVFLLFFLFFTLNAAENKKQKVSIGFGPYIQTQPYKGDTTPILAPSPVIFFDNSLFYIRWSRFGMYFLGKKEQDFAWGFSITAQPRTYGYKPSESKDLAGMDERKTTFEAGIAFSATMNNKYIESMLLTDVLRRHDSWIFKTEIGDKYNFGKLNIYPSLIIIYQSQQFLNYYFGVKHSEAIDKIRPAYTPGNGVLIGAQTYIRYPLTDKLSTFINIRADMLPKTAYNSPIVSDKYIYSGLLSLIYTFEY